MEKSDSEGRRKRLYRALTVAQIRDPHRAGDLQVAFLESARFYRLPRTNPKFDEYLQLLRAAMTEGHALEVGLASLDSDIIEDVRGPA